MSRAGRGQRANSSPTLTLTSTEVPFGTLSPADGSWAVTSPGGTCTFWAVMITGTSPASCSSVPRLLLVVADEVGHLDQGRASFQDSGPDQARQRGAGHHRGDGHDGQEEHERQRMGAKGQIAGTRIRCRIASHPSVIPQSGSRYAAGICSEVVGQSVDPTEVAERGVDLRHRALGTGTGGQVAAAVAVGMVLLGQLAVAPGDLGPRCIRCQAEDIPGGVPVLVDRLGFRRSRPRKDVLGSPAGPWWVGAGRIGGR